MSKLGKVTGHEFRMTAATKTFLILTILGPFLITAMAVLPTVLSSQGERKQIEIAAVGLPEGLYRQVAPPLEAMKIKLTRWEGAVSELDSRVLRGQLYGYLSFPEDPMSASNLQLVSREVADFKIVALLKSMVGQAIVGERLRSSGLDSSSIRRMIAAPEITNQQITKSGQKVQQDLLSSILIGITFTMMLYMTILLYGQSIGRSVVQEKISKTVEIMLSSVDARDLLFGKILGQAAASLLQYAVWIGMALLFMRILGPSLNLNQLPQLSGALPLYLVLFFLLGFFLYAGLYAAMGAAAEDEHNLGQLSWPILLFLILPMVSVGAIVTNPASSYSVLLSLFPLTSPIVMFVRIMMSDPGAWQIFLSVALLVAAILSVMLLSAKIFRVGILMMGKRFKWREILRWIRA